jgi:PAS domain S-box-containing protein
MCQHDHPCAEVERLKSKIADLEHQLEVHARTVLEQSVKLSEEQVQLRLQKTLLECQSEASIDGLLGVSNAGEVLSFNQRLIEMWGIPQAVIDTRSAEAVMQLIRGRLVSPQAVMARMAFLSEHRDERSQEEIALQDGRTFDYYSAPIKSREGIYYGRVWYFRDITAHKQAEEEVQQSEQRFRTLTSHAPMGIFLADDRGDCLFVNEHWCELAGMTATAALRRGWIQAIHPEDRPRIVQEWYGAAESGRPFAAEYRFQDPEGRILWLDGTGGALRNNEGEITGYLGTVMDITVRKQADQQKTDFVSFTTHQLRTPLAGIKWLLELATEEGQEPTEVRSWIQDARQSADRLAQLVNDLLDISRLEQGKLTLAPEPVQLEEMTRSVLAEMTPLLQEKGHELSVTHMDAIPAVMVDPQLIRQVILNLISNAVKYTPPGGDIAVTVRRAGASVCWAVRDSGIGIPKDSQRRLFEKFYRADNVFKVETEGTGLGLYLVRLIVEQCRGRVWCQSEEGKGTTFLFTLPLPAGQ